MTHVAMVKRDESRAIVKICSVVKEKGRGVGRGWGAGGRGVLSNKDTESGTFHCRTVRVNYLGFQKIPLSHTLSKGRPKKFGYLNRT